MLLRKDILLIIYYIVFLIYGVASDESEDNQKTDREKKVLPIFQVVRFPNDVCTGTSRNGTCYTAEECSSKGGTNQGSCASGFGVCCSFTLSCGGSASENNTYIEQSAVTSLSTNPCNHKICPCATSICRIRYDFSTFVIASSPSVTATSTSTGTANSAFNYGQCVTDSFAISAPGSQSSPAICGTNTGYHMILDSDGVTCQNANFNIGGSTTSTRQWNIRVTQYTCAEQDVAGPPGCLQYYTQTANTIESYAFPTSYTSGSTVAADTMHLADQLYDICIRRASGYCYICYAELISTTTAVTSFGVSLSGEDATEGNVDTDCHTDYLEIPFGYTAAIASIGTAIAALTQPASYLGSRFCGRRFAGTDGATSSTICSQIKPFRVGVHFDSFEICPAIATTAGCEWNIAASTMSSGTLGFKLIYWQNSC